MDNLSTVDKIAGPNVSFIKRSTVYVVHCFCYMKHKDKWMGWYYGQITAWLGLNTVVSEIFVNFATRLRFAKIHSRN